MDYLEMTKQVVRPKRMSEHGFEKNLMWSDIKDFVNSLSEEQLQQELIVWGDEKGGGIFSIAIAQDDLINPSGDGVEPVSFYANSEDADDRETAENESIVISKGSIILELDF